MFVPYLKVETVILLMLYGTDTLRRVQHKAQEKHGDMVCASGWWIATHFQETGIVSSAQKKKGRAIPIHVTTCDKGWSRRQSTDEHRK